MKQKKRKVILTVASENIYKLDDFVEECIVNGVGLIAVMGENSSLIDDIIDEIVVGDGSDKSRFILTSFHPGETLDEVMEFAHLITGDYEDEIEVIEL